jgi:hypothetical protein
VKDFFTPESLYTARRMDAKMLMAFFPLISAL